MDFDQELNRIARGYSTQGYHVIIRPKPDDLPSFARDFLVEIVAVRGEEGILAAVKRNQEEVAADGNLPRYAERTAEQRNWRFDLIVVEGQGPMGRQPAEARDFSADDVVRTLAEAGELARAGFLRPAALSAWAALEAAMRLRLRASGERAGWGTAARVMANELYSSGILSADEFRQIEKFFSVRNEIVHGFASPAPDAVSVQFLTEIARRLAEESHPQPQTV
jgi:hypothetical protein